MKRFLTALLGLALSLSAAATQQSIPAATLPSGTVVLGSGAVPAMTANFTDLYAQIATLQAQLAAMTTGSGNAESLELCSQPFVDNTGNTDNRAQLLTYGAQTAAAGQDLLIDCPIKVSIGYDITKPVFIRSNWNFKFGPNGRFLVDNNLIPAFVIDCASNVNWSGAKFQWVGSDPLDTTQATGVAWWNSAGQFNDVTLTNDMIANCGNTFASGKAWWTSPSNIDQILVIKGNSNHITFTDTQFFVAPTAGANNFIMGAVAIDPQFTVGTAITSAIDQPNNANATYLSVGQDINFIRTKLDGVLMGFTGTGNVNIDGLRSYRYSDLQDNSYITNGVGGSQGGTVAGATCSASVSCWMAPPHLFYMYNGDPSFGTQLRINDVIDYGQYVGGTTRRYVGSGTALSLKIGLNSGNSVTNYTTQRPDGAIDFISSPTAYPPLPGSPGATLRNFTATYNSGLYGSGGAGLGYVWGIRFPGGPYCNATIQNLSITDTAAAPTSWPFLGNASLSNCDVSMTGIKVFMADWPNSTHPSPTWGGTNISLEAEYHFNNFTSTTTSIGPIVNQGADDCVSCNFDVKLYGWHQPAITFSALATGATTGTLSTAQYPSGWPFENGTYSITFTDGEIRWTTFTNGSNSIGSFPALSNTSYSLTFATAPAAGTNLATITPAWPNASCTCYVTLSTGQIIQIPLTSGSVTTGQFSVPVTGTPTTSATAGTISNAARAGNFLVNDFTGYRPRILVNYNSGSLGSRAHILDVSDGYEATAFNGELIEYWDQVWQGTPSGTTSTGFPTNISYPSTFAIDRATVYVNTALASGPTSQTLGWTGTTSALLSGIGVGANANAGQLLSPVTLPNNPTIVTVYPVGASFGSTGNERITTHAVQVSAAR